SAKNRRYSNQWAPRLSVLKKVNSHISVYGSVSKGYSPPTTSELLPSSGIIATDLEAEQGTNFELGSRGTLAQSRFSYDVNAFYFALKNAIVIRRDNLGRDYFVNAGQTRQAGLETQLSYWWNKGTGALWSASRMWVSHTGYGFRYKNFVKGNLDYSGKQLPSVPQQNIVVGIDAQLKSGFYANITYTYTDPIPLNDANTSWSLAMHLLGVRAGYKKILNRNVRLDLFVSGDNLTNTNYSLGYDLNANGGRYFNPAPRRNVVAGLTLDWLK
ncbi:MAG: TonB-dependent receptor domain-containing protein, partial [Chitinophagaceae bacterium]